MARRWARMGLCALLCMLGLGPLFLVGACGDSGHSADAGSADAGFEDGQIGDGTFADGFGADRAVTDGDTDGGPLVEPADDPVIPQRGYFLGVLPFPAADQSMEDAYALAAGQCEFAPVWGRPSPFWELADELDSAWGATFVETLIRANSMFPLVHLTFLGAGLSLATPAGLEGATLDDPAWRAAYRQAAVEVVAAARPRYLSLGNEVNRWYEAHGADPLDPNGFQHFVSLYHETYDAVKAISPRVEVFCTFAREVVAENRLADVASALALFDPERLDLLVVTSYPHAVQSINHPDDIPADYYTSIASLAAGKPFGFSEVAWPSAEPFGGQPAQADFLTRLVGPLTRQQGVDLHLVGWPWLCDIDENDTTGLIDHNGTPKAAWATWQSL
jgi:hypothetical protein